MFKITSDGAWAIEYSVVPFSGGELQPRLNRAIASENVHIRADLRCSNDIVELILVVDAIRRASNDVNIYLCCPYLPYARQDRVCAPGEALGIKVMCDIINSLKFEEVEVWDVHSDVALALLDRVRNVPQKEFIHRLYKHTVGSVLVAPDAGAIKKTMEAAKLFGCSMVRADKIRSVQDGSITGTTVYSEHIGSKNFLVVDDICDGGRTFIELAKVLRPLTDGELHLYVTHGIFSRGLEPLWAGYDLVLTANIWPGFEDVAKLYPTRLVVL